MAALHSWARSLQAGGLTPLDLALSAHLLPIPADALAKPSPGLGIDIQLPRIHLLKRSEKGYEPRSDREFGRCRETKMGGKVPFWCFVRLHRRLLRPFS